MSRLSNFLVGIDLTQPEFRLDDQIPVSNQVAVDRAIEMASRVQGSITFFASANFQESPPAEEKDDNFLIDSDLLYERSQALLARLVEQAEEKGVQAKSKFVPGKGWLELTKETVQADYDALIIGTRNRSAASRMLYGSTGMKLVRKCACPVWIVKAEQNSKQDDEPKTILAADDFSEVGIPVLETAVELAKQMDARLQIVHAVETPRLYDMQRTGLTPEKTHAYIQELQEQATEKLNNRLSQTDYRAVERGVKTRIITGIPETIVCDMIEQEQIDLLVMGTVGRAGIPGFLLGNFAERILPEIDCSLFAIKPEDFVSPVTLG